MDEAELDRRLEAALDPQQSRALAVLEAADGIGDQRALAIAEAYGSVETIAAHSPSEVAERVDDIGPTYAGRAVRAARDAAATGEVAAQVDGVGEVYAMRVVETVQQYDTS